MSYFREYVSISLVCFMFAIGACGDSGGGEPDDTFLEPELGPDVSTTEDAAPEASPPDDVVPDLPPALPPLLLEVATFVIPLIPTRNMGAHTNDHTWNEFWDGVEWFGWEPIGSSIGHKKYYGDNVYACTWTRGDSYVTTDSQTWGEAFDVELTVTDEAGAPVDGARAIIFGDKDDGKWHYVYEAFTDVEGVARANIGRGHDYGLMVQTSFGDWPEPDSLGLLVEGPVEDDLVSVSVAVPGTKAPGPAAVETDLVGGLMLDVDLRVETHLDATRTLAATLTYDTTFSRASGPARLLRFVTDAEGYAAFQAGDAPAAMGVATVLDAAQPLDVQLSLDREWFVVLANPGFLHTVVLGGVTVTATPHGEGDWTKTLDAPFEIPPGEHLAIRLISQD